MIYLIDGEDAASSRNRLNELIDNKSAIIRIDGKKQGLGDVSDSLESNDLFIAKRTIIIEHFSKIKTQVKLFEILQKFHKDKETLILLWENTLVKGKIPSGIIRNSFSYPKVFYSFLDGFTPKNAKNTLNLMQEVMRNMTAEQVFFSLSKRVRHLLYIKSGNNSFEEVSKLAPWQMGKLREQSAQWSLAQLEKMVIEVAATDEKIKTSALSLPLAKHLDILILSAIK